MLTELLNELGLNATETALFVALYEEGPQTASMAAKKTSLNRTTAYMALQNLIKKGLVSEDVRSKVSRFIAEKPQSLISLIEAQEDHLQQLKKRTENMLPELETMMNIAGDLPKFKQYEGLAACKNSYFELLSLISTLQNKTMYGYVLPITDDDNPELYNFLNKHFVNERLRRNIKIKCIVPDVPEAYDLIKDDAKLVRETRIVPDPKFPFDILQLFIAVPFFFYFSLRKGKLVSTIIFDEDLALAQKAMWDLAWKYARSS